MASLLVLSACGQSTAPDANAAAANMAGNGQPTIVGPVTRAVVRLPAVPGRPASGYFTYQVTGDRGALISVSSPQVARIEMHETMNMAGHMSEMRPIARIPVRDGETLSFTEGGRHLMLFDISRDVHAGGRIDLILHFERGDPETLPARMVPTGGDI
jgi:copper(I)-binding protein